MSEIERDMGSSEYTEWLALMSLEADEEQQRQLNRRVASGHDEARSRRLG